MSNIWNITIVFDISKSTENRYEGGWDHLSLVYCGDDSLTSYLGIETAILGNT